MSLKREAPAFTILPKSTYKPSRWTLLLSVLAGLLYGMALRWLADTKHHPLGVMSLGFVMAVPFVMGFVSVFVVERKSHQSFGLWFFLPWLTISLALLASMAVLWEGFICVVMFAPIAWLCGSVGGVLGGIIAQAISSSTAVQSTTLMFVMVLPFLVNPISQRLLQDENIRSVSTQIDVDAPPEIVWRNIERVPAIHSGELPPAWSRRIGFPAPDEATLSFEGVGAIRHATFAGGVLFTETVDTWEPNHRLAFSIHADTEHIPNTTLDEHVRVGGPYFDVLHGDYAIEPLPNGKTRLHLSSRHRVSTDFNWYAHLWTDGLMRDIQNSILFVIKNRCEGHKN